MVQADSKNAECRLLQTARAACKAGGRAALGIRLLVGPAVVASGDRKGVEAQGSRGKGEGREQDAGA